MVILNKKAFRLPRVEREKFILLLRLGLEYNRDQGTFSISNYNNIEKLVDTVSSILNTEVSFTQSCIGCGKDFPCTDCNYNELCTTKNFPASCVCTQCLREPRLHQEQLKL